LCDLTFRVRRHRCFPASRAQSRLSVTRYRANVQSALASRHVGAWMTERTHSMQDGAGSRGQPVCCAAHRVRGAQGLSKNQRNPVHADPQVHLDWATARSFEISHWSAGSACLHVCHAANSGHASVLIGGRCSLRPNRTGRRKSLQSGLVSYRYSRCGQPPRAW